MFPALSRLLTPSLIVRHVTDVPADYLRDRGIVAVVSDLDNTLLPYHGADDAISPEVLGWLEGLRNAGIGVCLASNTTRLTRLARLAASWGILHVPRTAGKPGTAGIRHALHLLGASPQNAAMVGDQLFTDMVAGNRLGMFTVLVNPLSKQEFVGTRLVSRNLERLAPRSPRRRYNTTMNLQALLPQLPFLLVTLFAFISYGTMVRREILTGARIWQGGVVIGLIAVVLSVLNDRLNVVFEPGTSPAAHWMNPGVMVFCTAYCIFFAYRLQKVSDVAAWTIGDARILLRVSPVSKITDADALIVPTGTRLEMRNGVPGQIGNAGGQSIADAAKSFAPVGLGKVIVTPPGTLAAKKIYHVAVYEGGKPIKLDVLKRFVAQGLIAARKDGAETVYIPLGAYPGLTVESASKAIAETAQKQSKGYREIVLCVIEGRDEREAAGAVRSVLGAPTPATPASVAA